MKKLLVLAGVFAGLWVLPAQGQGLMKKLKDKVNQTVDKTLNNEVQKQTGVNTGNEPGNTTGKPANKGGAGLTNTEPPDVKASMNDAMQTHKAGKYTDARFALQQALMGVEIQLGRQVLKSLPMTVAALAADTLKDKVSSSQWGWSNLAIQRVYSDKADKQLTITIGNAGGYNTIAQYYLSNPGLVDANAARQQNIKQVMVKGNKGVIQYEESTGYTLFITLGQSSGILWECINFATEQEVMTAANSFDIDGIKKILGEQ